MPLLLSFSPTLGPFSLLEAGAFACSILAAPGGPGLGPACTPSAIPLQTLPAGHGFAVQPSCSEVSAGAALPSPPRAHSPTHQSLLPRSPRAALAPVAPRVDGRMHWGEKWAIYHKYSIEILTTAFALTDPA